MATRVAVASLVVISLVTAVVPAVAQAPRYRQAYDLNQIRFRGGLFTPDGGGDYWDDKELDFSGNAEGFEDGVFAVDYARSLIPFLDVEVGYSGFEGAQHQRYLDITDTEGASIEHLTELQISRFDLGVRVRLAPLEFPIVPYLAAGGALAYYDLIESGEFVDFNPPPPTIFDDTFRAEGEALGWYAAAGLEAMLGQSWSLFAEYRHVEVEDDLGGDFADFGSLDLSGREITAGVGFRF